jgi:hypothetical protein
MSSIVEQSLAENDARIASDEQCVEGNAPQFFVGMMAQPKQKDATLGVIVIGLGVADMLAVRQFAKLGMVAMQIRLIKDSTHHNDFDRRFATYDASGVSRCRQAMELLAAKHHVKQFILMGNCTLANICFNTALVDSRVVGLVITNPYIPEALCETFFFKLQKHLFRKESWLRLLTGRMQVPRPAATGQGDRKPRVDATKTATSNANRDTILPADFDLKFQQLLTDRAVKTLLVFSAGETSLYYFRHHYGKMLAKLSRAGKLRFEVTDVEGHDFSAHDDCAAALNEVVADWAQKTWTSASSTGAL